MPFSQGLDPVDDACERFLVFVFHPAPHERCRHAPQTSKPPREHQRDQSPGPFGLEVVPMLVASRGIPPSSVYELGGS